MAQTFKEIPVSKIHVQEGFNPRMAFDVDDLASDIAVNGVLSPLIVRPADNDGYLLVDGERRYRAIQLLAEDDNAPKKVPCQIRELDDAEALTIALATGTGSEPLTVLEEAEAVWRFYKGHKWNQRQIADNLGKSQGWVQGRCRLASAEPEVKDAFARGKIKLQRAVDLARAPKSRQVEYLSDKWKFVDGEWINPNDQTNGQSSTRRPGRKEVLIFVQDHIQSYSDEQWTADEVAGMLGWAAGEFTRDHAVECAGTEPPEPEIEEIDDDDDTPEPPKAPGKPS